MFLLETVKKDIALYNANEFVQYLSLFETENSLYQLCFNGIELWYGTLEEINAVVKSILRLKNGNLQEYGEGAG